MQIFAKLHLLSLLSLVALLGLGWIAVNAQDDCEADCTDEEKIVLICQDIESKVDEVFDPIDDRYRVFQEKYSKNKNLLDFTIKRFGELGLDNELMIDAADSVDKNNSNMQQLYDTMARDVIKIKDSCGLSKIDLEIIKIQRDRKNFDDLMKNINKDLKSLKLLIQNI